MPIVQKLIKPTIRLIGLETYNNPDGSDWRQTNRLYDHSVVVDDPRAGKSISVTSNLYKENLPTFYNSVRVVLDCDVSYPRYTYGRNSSANRFFTGKVIYSNRNNAVGEFAEIYYTLNGKDPCRTRSYLYKYDSPKTFLNPSTSESPANWEIDYDIIGFAIESHPGDSDGIVLKAKVYYQGNESDIAEVKFRIIRDLSSVSEESIRTSYANDNLI